MSTHILSRRREKYELINRMLNHTTLTTQKVAHENIIDLGELIQKKYNVDVDGEKDKAVEQALKEAEKRHSRELRAALKRLEKNLIEDKRYALEKQQRYFEEKAKRVAEQRDRAEEERIRELRKKWEKEKEEALKEQWEECERLKQIAVQEACDALTRKLRNEFALEKERAIAEALAKAREQFRIREQEAIARTRRECEEEFARELARVEQIHAEEMAAQQKKYDILEKKYMRELAHKQRVEEDFKTSKYSEETHVYTRAYIHENALQHDYRRFMDYTDGKYHSDFMMHLRSHGLNLAGKRVSVVRYEDIQEF